MYLLERCKSTKMTKSSIDLCEEARGRLIDVAGATCQELGLGRVIGQVLVYLYLQEDECSLDEIEAHLGLSWRCCDVFGGRGQESDITARPTISEAR